MATVGSGEGRGNAATTPSGFVLVSTYSWTVITVGVLVARFWQGHNHKVEVCLDDLVIVAATVVYIGTTVSWQYAISGGLGKDSSSLSGENITLFFKATYVASILGIVAMALAKLSSALLIERVIPQTRKAKSILLGMIAIFAIFSPFAISFRCGIPEWTMQSLECRNGGLAIAVIVSNIVTDLLLAFWMVPALWEMSLNKEKNLAAATLFGVRAIVAFVAGGQIWAIVRIGSSRNPTRDAVEFVVLTQTVSSLSLIVASVPRIKRFLGASGSGMLYPDIQETELSVSRKSSGGRIEPKLVPSGTGNFTVTVSSRGTREKKNKLCGHLDWHTPSMGTSADEHASTSSLFGADEREGVIMQQDVIVSVEDRKPPKAALKREDR